MFFSPRLDVLSSALIWFLHANDCFLSKRKMFGAKICFAEQKVGYKSKFKGERDIGIGPRIRGQSQHWKINQIILLLCGGHESK